MPQIALRNAPAALPDTVALAMESVVGWHGSSEVTRCGRRELERDLAQSRR